MSLFSLITALLLEHFHPLQQRLALYQQLGRYAEFLERHFNAGERRHGMIAWLLVAIPLVGGVAIISAALYQVNPLLAWLWNAAVLYATMGFKYFSDITGHISAALRAQDFEKACDYLGRWREQSIAGLEPNEIARLTIEQSLLWAHRQMFSVLFWFVLLGPAGAVLYRLASVLNYKWGELDQAEAGDFGQFASRVFGWIDWLPVRLSAISFAVVGDFEDAMYCWRTQGLAWANHSQGIILASGAGALGVKLGEPLHQGGNLEFRPELGMGDEADADYVQSAVSLIWRALLLWLTVVLLLQLGRWVGG
jgi:cobalamin biosynthesis protein CobD/CbiB